MELLLLLLPAAADLTLLVVGCEVDDKSESDRGFQTGEPTTNKKKKGSAKRLFLSSSTLVFCFVIFKCVRC